MSHVQHIHTNKEFLTTRAHIIRLIREFFWSEGFLEMETPTILRLPGQEPYLSPMKLTLHNEREEEFTGYLHTSPEYTMKKMLAAGFAKIFSLCKVFRDHESFGGTHNPEFTMIEWYRANSDFWQIMQDCEKLIQCIITELQKVSPHQIFPAVQPFERLHMRDAWQKYANVNLDDYLNREKMLELVKAKGYMPKDNEPYEDLFFRIFLNEIEPHLGVDHPIIVHHYPLPMAALSKVSATNQNYAERFELYWGGMELANCFTELTDPGEQLRRLQKEQQERKQAGKDVFVIDAEFIDALHTMPPSGGVALGVDRLVQVLLSIDDIDRVLPLPMSKLFG